MRPAVAFRPMHPHLVTIFRYCIQHSQAAALYDFELPPSNCNCILSAETAPQDYAMNRLRILCMNIRRNEQVLINEQILA